MSQDDAAAEGNHYPPDQTISGSQNKNKKQPLNRVALGDPNEQDLVLSYVTNLPSDCTVDILVPNYLIGLKKCLETHTFGIRKHARDKGTRTSTHVRLDEFNESLVLATQTGG